MLNDSKNSFILYKSYYNILCDLQDSDLGNLFRAILEYQANGKLIKLPLNLDIAFKFIKNQFEIDNKKYDEFVTKQSANGKKGGRPKIEKQEQENPKNPSLFLKTQKSLNDNVNENENVNENVNDNSLSPKENEREILENYVIKKRLATKNVTAYVNKIIENGDHIKILESLKKSEPKQNSKERIKEELASITDKRSAARVLSKYHAKLIEPPSEFDEIAVKYNLDTYDKLVDYSYELKRLQEESKYHQRE